VSWVRLRKSDSDGEYVATFLEWCRLHHTLVANLFYLQVYLTPWLCFGPTEAETNSSHSCWYKYGRIEIGRVWRWRLGDDEIAVDWIADVDTHQPTAHVPRVAAATAASCYLADHVNAINITLTVPPAATVNTSQFTAAARDENSLIDA